jgi:hypothetical protein
MVVYLDPILGVPDITPSTVRLGQPVTISVEIAGGSGNESYRWSGLPPGCLGTGAVITCSPTEAGSYPVSLTVEDGNGGVGNSPTATLNVTPASTSSAILGLPPADVAVVIGVALVLAVFFGVLLLRARGRQAPP